MFFDLIYVAMAFKLGDQLADDLDNRRYGDMIFFFLAQFCPMYVVWFSRTTFLSQFITDSFFHSVADVVTALLVAFMALFIGTSDQIREGIKLTTKEDEISENFTEAILNNLNVFSMADDEDSAAIGFNTLLGFSASLFLLELFYMGRVLEMRTITAYKGVGNEREQKAVINTAGVFTQRHFMGLLWSGAAIAAAYYGKLELALGFLLVHSFSSIAYYLLRRFFCRTGISEQVPINVGFTIQRLGEFNMWVIYYLFSSL